MPPNHITNLSLSEFKHGFFTRLGGVSTGQYESLNCGVSQWDQAENVERNLAIVAQSLDLRMGSVLTARQSHSAEVAKVESSSARPDADALVTCECGVAIGVLTADCLPILMADAQAGVVAAAHGGWRGTIAGVIENTIQAMHALGARLERIDAVIGPAISARNYEVGPEFRSKFMTDDPASSPFFTVRPGGQLYFDLPSFALMRLRRSGIRSAEWIRHCTYSEPAKFFSCRRSSKDGEKEFGLQISVISA